MDKELMCRWKECDSLSVLSGKCAEGKVCSHVLYMAAGSGEEKACF
jgi:hypothetical protein